MPIYPLKNTETEEIFEKVMKIAEYETYMQENPHIQRYYEMGGTIATIGDPVRLGIKQPPADFQKYIIGRMKAAIPGNTLHDRKYSIPSEF